MEKIQFDLDHRSYEQILLGAVVFSNVHGYLGETKTARELQAQILKEGDTRS
jgi:cobalt-precorrin-5B (C1)-methyltransferase